jgi:GH15 family glucan-1,4-alpha-glucosidase
MQQTLDLAVIGNSSIAALIDRAGKMVWCCWPRIDGDPVFCALLNGEAESGFLAVEADGPSTSEQSYLHNTPIVRTVHNCRNHSRFAITDFVPRFRQHNRIFRPPMIIRMIEPLDGPCRIRVRMRPLMVYGAERPVAVQGSNHIRYIAPGGTLRLTTNAPIAYLLGENGFVLTRKITLILHADESLSDSIERIGQDFLEQTRDYWRDWVRYLSVPYEWQEAVIRAAITLKLCSFEETGAMVAALTTSIPEAAQTARNWDYRYCWIRDAFFTVRAQPARRHTDHGTIHGLHRRRSDDGAGEELATRLCDRSRRQAR